MKSLSLLLKLILGFCCVIQSFGQTELSKSTIDLTWSKEYKSSSEFRVNRIIALDEDHTFLFKVSKNKIEASLFDAENIRIKTSKLVHNRFDEKLLFQECHNIGNRLWLYFSNFEKLNDTETLFVQEYDPFVMSFIGEPLVITEVEIKKERLKGLKFKINLSSDSSKVLVMADKSDYKLNLYGEITSDSLKLELITLHNYFTILWQREIEFPYERKYFHLFDHIIDNEGNVHILGEKLTSGINRKESGKPNYYFKLWSVLDKGSKLVKNRIDLSDQFIVDLKMEEDKEGNLICVGFYSEESSYTSKGIYYSKFAKKTGKRVIEKTTEFGLSTIKRNQYRTKKNNKISKLKELFKFHIDYLLLNPDGSIKLIAEQDLSRAYVQQQTESAIYSSFSATRPRSTSTFSAYNTSISDKSYKNNNIIVFKINLKGELIWSETIGKRQSTVNDRGVFSSYVLFQKKDDLYFVYNDNIKNYNEENDYMYNMTFGKNGVASMSKLDDEGNVSRQQLFLLKDHKLLFRPKPSIQIPNKNIILLAHEGKKLELGKLIIVE